MHIFPAREDVEQISVRSSVHIRQKNSQGHLNLMISFGPPNGVFVPVSLVQEIECKPGFFIELYEPGAIENQVKVTKI